MAKYVVFDFDGTLVDSKAVFLSAFNHLADKYRFGRIDETNIPALLHMSMRERMRVLKVPYYKLPILTSEFISLYRGSLHNIVFVDGMVKVLQQLEQTGYKVAIVSSNAVSSIQAFLHKQGIDHIKEIWSSSRLFGKDRAINKFLQKNKLRSTDIIYIGDEQRDIVACKKLGVRIVWVAWGFEIETVVDASVPDFKAHAPTDILNIIQANL